MPKEREKWNTDHLPDGYPSQCETEELKKVIQDLNDEYVIKTRNGKNNVIWEHLISNLIESGHNNLKQRELLDNKGSWFSMNNPFIYILVILILAVITYFTHKLGWPLKFGFN